MPPRSRKRPLPQPARPVLFGLPLAVVLPLGAMLLVTLLIGIARIRLLGLPLERDEGEYAYTGQLMLRGVAPYGAAANMKLPGTSAAYALLMAVFGQSVSGIHFGFLLVNLGSVVLVFFLAKKLFGLPAGVSAAASYAVLSTGASVLGLWAHATHFVVLPALGATLLLLAWSGAPKPLTLIASGLLFGLAFLMKQPGVFFAVFGAWYLIHLRRARWLPLFAAAVLAPFALTCLVLWAAGVFGSFWFWVFDYGRQYASMLPLAAGFATFRTSASAIFADNWPLCLLAAAGLWAGFRTPVRRPAALVLTVFLVCSFLAVCPSLYFRKHYFVLLMPALALLVGMASASSREIVLWAVAAALAFAVFLQSDFLFRLGPTEIERAAYGSNPFPEALPLAAYLRDHTSPGDRIAVVGSEPEIYFYAQRRSVTPYVYVYSMMEPQPFAPRMQAEFIHDVETARPRYLVVVNVSTSWLLWKGSPQGILRWIARYSQQFDTVGVADIGPAGTVFRWDADAARYAPQSSNSVLILRRKDAR